MGLIYRKRKRLGEHTTANLSGHGVSLSEHVGPVTVNSRGRITLRLGRGLSWRVRS
jgi:hypothetical protein